MTVCQLAKMRSDNTQAFTYPFGLALRNSDGSKQVIEMLSKLGLSASFPSMEAARRSIAKSCKLQAREVALGDHMDTWDNVQVETSKFIEQRPGAQPKVTTGTANMLYALRGYHPPSAFLLAPILERAADAEPITFEEVAPTSEIHSRVRVHQIQHIVEMLLESAELFQDHPNSAVYAASPLLKHAATRPPPSGYKTRQYPVETVKTPENTAKGNLDRKHEVYERILGIPHGHISLQRARLCINDQATDAHVRGAKDLRRHETTDAFSRFEDLQLAPGLFHALMNMLWTLLAIHCGAHDHSDLGSFNWFIHELSKSRHGSAHTDYHSSKATALQILSGLVLSAWESACDDLKVFAQSKPTPENLFKKASSIGDT